MSLFVVLVLKWWISMTIEKINAMKVKMRVNLKIPQKDNVYVERKIQNNHILIILSTHLPSYARQLTAPVWMQQVPCSLLAV